ncbi:urease accessory protein UreF [Octadecabacter sp. 1_MG-2023]|uniref:urease accessory protein UreF n=1 Tax=Octadecabacter TaxID=53945 RepID=UPI001C08D211|nr:MULTISPECIES: urease accessory protein UreF [Octadecabacter]MBU2993030.1 urease accessory protein UreF [Octadecabacter sp. B2R22]MCF2904245.1 urease accessory protein UreF [Octadecabacter algicola]MDO6733518.1 urease accessory protein UreF [Octadecabacter sp. 1_MG-2023]
MTTNRDVLTLTQWLSPSFPLGSFAYSHGLETAIANGTLATATDLQDWLTDLLAHGSGRNDCILLRAGYDCGDDGLADVNATALAFAASSERIQETLLQGAAFCQTTAAIWGDNTLPELALPVAVGMAAARQGIDQTLTASMYLQAFCSNLVSASVRAVPLGQTEGQAVLAALSPLCIEIAEDTANATLDDLQSTAFLSDIAAMQHETLQPRIFRS